MTEPILTATTISILVILAGKTIYTIVRRVRKSKCVDSKGRSVEINMGHGESNSSLSTNDDKADRRHRKKRHRHHRHREPLKRKNPKKNMSNNNKDENK